MKYFNCAFFIIMIFSGCVTNTVESYPMKKTIEWEFTENEFIQYYTNDPNNYNIARWIFYDNLNQQSVYEIECKKLSGAISIGYGILFDVSDYDNNVCKLFEINTLGQYTILSHSLEGRWEKIKDWTTSEGINKGFDVINNIKISKMGNAYIFFINGSEIYQLAQTKPSGDRFGLFIQTGTESVESFPNIPADIQFKIVQ